MENWIYSSEQDLKSLFTKLGTCSTILTYYGDLYTSKRVLKSLCKETNSVWHKIKKPLKMLQGENPEFKKANFNNYIRKFSKSIYSDAYIKDGLVWTKI